MVRPRSHRPPRLTRSDLGLGPATTAWLADIGVDTRDDLRRLGVIPACRAMHLLGHPISVVGAYALHAVLIGCSWQQVPPADRADLRRRFAAEVRGAQPRSTPVAGRRSARRR